MSTTSFQDLMRQVESLRAENTHLRRELQDNSSHLSQLENQSHSMRDVLTHVVMQQEHDGDSHSLAGSDHENNMEAVTMATNPTTTTTATTMVAADPDKDEDDSLVSTAANSVRRGGEELSKLSNSSTHSLADMSAVGAGALVDNSDSSGGRNDSNEGPYMEEQEQEYGGAGGAAAGGMMLDQNSNAPDETCSSDQSWFQLPAPPNTRGLANMPRGGPTASSNSGAGSVGGGKTSSSGGGSPTSPTSSGESPLKKRATGGSSSRELYNYLQELDHERNALVTEIENEDLHRRHYYQQLEALQHKLDSLPRNNDKYKSAVAMSRRQLEYEMQRLHELMARELGPPDAAAARQDARLARVRAIEGAMLRAQQTYHSINAAPAAPTQRSEPDNKRDSGTCDHLELDQGNGVVVIDACTNTHTNRESFPNPLTSHDADSHHSSGHYDGHYGGPLVTISTQTPGGGGDTYLPPDVVASATVDPAAAAAERRLSNQNLAALYHGAWPIDNAGGGALPPHLHGDTASVMSFNSSNASSSSSRHRHNAPGGGYPPQQQLGTKVEMVYSLLSMLGTHDKDDMSRTLLAMSSSQDSCIAMRQSGCLPLLIQLLHGSDSDNGLLGKTRGSRAARARAAAALHNIVHSHPDDKRGRREARVLRLLEQIRAHCDQLRHEDEDDEKNRHNSDGGGKSTMDHHPGPAIAALMKWSFDEEHRHAICTLGGLQAIAELLQTDYNVNGNTAETYNITMRRYACMALTNLTFGDGTNKAQLCSMRAAMEALVAQLGAANEDLRQVAASVLRNLSWRADLASKKTLREVDSVTALMHAAMQVKKESTLKSVLSALWNLSAHCSENKADVCAVDGALAFLVSTLVYKSPSQTLAIIENGGGILRNVSSHVAVREEYRCILRQHGALHILLKHLRSPSLTIVSNACGTLWNLSARCPEDQRALWELNAVSMLKNLVHSKHKMISMGSAAALKNLLSARPHLGLENDSFSNPKKPGLHIRKQRALEAEIDQNLAETCDNMESPVSSPPETRKHPPDRHKYIYSNDNCGIYQVADSAELRRSQQQQQQQQQQHHRHYSGGNNGLYHNSRGGTSSLDTSPLGSGDNKHFPLNGHPSSGRSVSRSGSQDSVGSVHSDISHDRRGGGGGASTTRSAALDRSSRLLQHRGSASADRRSSAGGSGGAVRHSSADGRGGGGGYQDSGANGHHNSRIMQMMHEVVQHAETDPAVSSAGGHMSRSRSQENTTTAGQPRYHTDRRGQQQQQAGGGVMHRSMDERSIDLSNLSNRFEKLHLSLDGADIVPDDDDDADDDQPINYSAQFQETPSATPPKNSATAGQSGQSAFSKPQPKVDNYMGGMKYQPAPAPQGYSGGVPAASSGAGKVNTSATTSALNSSYTATTSTSKAAANNTGAALNSSYSSKTANANALNSSYSAKGNANAVVNTSGMNGSVDYGGYGGPGEEVVDAEDQPTNFSMRYAEEHEDDDLQPSDDQPINFSARYESERGGGGGAEPPSDCADCHLVAARRTNALLEETDDLIAGDSVRTFCTEGTPLVFLSTATSLTDLTGAGAGAKTDDEKAVSAPPPPQQDSPAKDELKNYAAKCSETDTADSHSTGRTVIAPGNYHPNMHPNIQNNNLPTSGGGKARSLPGAGEKSSSSNQPSLYSYNDSSSSNCTSPSSGEVEKPKTYATEGTPMSFSRQTSLSSLHSSEAASGSPGGNQLGSIDETHNDSAASNNDVTLKDEHNDTIVGGANRTPTHQQQQQHVTSTGAANARQTPGGKSVTFDENNIVQETPLMFSRCSSLGSLSSFDAHSVHSSVLSDYSRRTSGAVSPSELPDSPSDTMPNTPPSHRRHSQGQKIGAPDTAVEGPEPRAPVPRYPQPLSHQQAQQPTIPEETGVVSPEAGSGKKIGMATPTNDGPRNYATEGSPDFSCATSLSALTIDDEPKIRKEDLTRVPLGEDDGMSARFSDLNKSSTGTSKTKSPEKEGDLTSQTIEELSLDESEDNSEVSEGEENLLAEFINLGMPTASSKVKKPIKKVESPAKPVTSRLPQPQSLNKSLNSTYSSTIVNTPKQKPQPVVQTPKTPNQRPSALAHLDLYDDDTPTKFATEGTPLNFSTATSLSDLSVDPDMSPNQSPGKKQEKSVNEPDDDKSDVSSLASEDNEDLLSEAIEAAMPNYTSKKQKPQPAPAHADRRAAGRSAHGVIRPSQQQQRFVNNYQQFKKPAPYSQQQQQQQHLDTDHGDSVKTYAVEGTPINFSRATSPFSELHPDEAEDLHHEEDDSMEDPFKANVVYMEQQHQPPSYPDSPKVYGMEGTPISYSRNDSLSDLSVEDDADLTRADLRAGGSSGKHGTPNSGQLNIKGTPVGARLSPKGGSKSVSPSRKSGIQSPAIARLKTPNRSFKHEPSMHSTPVNKNISAGGFQTPTTHSDEAPRVYAVEGTPDCFSRNSSLSSLDSDDHEALANNSGGSDQSMTGRGVAASVGIGGDAAKDNSRLFHVEDTPANLSGSSPLSSLSVESLSFEPTLEESALLEECINAALPKSTKTKKRKDESLSSSSASRISPPGASASSSGRRLSPKMVNIGEAASGSSQQQQPKNVNRPQAETAVSAGSIRTPPGNGGEPAPHTAENGHQHKTETFLAKHEKNASNQRQQCDSISDNDDEDVNGKEEKVGKETSHADMFDLDDENMQDIEIDANKLAETFQELENKFAELGMTRKSDAHEEELCLEAEPKQSASSKVQFSIDETNKDDNRRKVGPIPLTDSMTKSAKALARLSTEADMQSTESLEMGCRPLPSDSEDGDILKESFPDLSSSLVSNLTTPDLDKVPSLGSSSDNVLSNSAHGPSPLAMSTDSAEHRDNSPKDEKNTSANVTVLVEQDTLDADQIHNTIEDNITYQESDLSGELNTANITAEDEKLLEENANLILHELSSATEDLSHELLDPCLLEDSSDELLMEQEPISLVSNDYTSDTASEVSVSLSEDISEAISEEQASEVSSSTTVSSRSVKAQSVIKGPRIVKPGASRTPVEKQQPEEDNEPKGIRGKKKVYKSPYAAGAKTPAAASKQETPSSKGIRAGQAGIKRPNVKPPSPPERKSSQPAARTPPKPPVRTTPVKSQSPARSNSPKSITPPKSATPPKTITPPRTLVPAGNQKPSPKYGISVAQQKAGVKPTTGKNSGIPKPSPTKKVTATPPPPPLQSEQTVIERRPAPPIKEGTFTKDEAVNENAPTIDHRSSSVSMDLNGNKKLANRGSSTSVGSSASSAGEQRSSRASLGATTGGQQEAVTTPGRESRLKKPATTGIRKPTQQTPSPAGRGAPKSSPSVRATATVTGVSRSPAAGAASRTPPQKSSSANSLASKTPSANSLNKSNNSSNVAPARARHNSADAGTRASPVGRSKTPPRAGTAPRRNDSQSSLGGAGGSRSNTPPSRKNSVTTTAAAAAKTPAAGNSIAAKKAVVTASGVAVTKSVTTKKPAKSKIASLWRKEPKKSIEEKEEEKPQKAKGKKSLLLGGGKKEKKESEASQEAESKLKRSSTYDKLDDSNLTLPSMSTYEVEGKEVERASVSDFEGISAKEVAQRTMWRRTYTVKNDDNDDVQSFEIIGDAPSHHGSSSSLQIEETFEVINTTTSSAIPKAKGLKKPSIWRRDTDKKDKESKVKPEKGEKKRFSLFKRDSDSNKDKTTAGKKPGPGYVKNDNGVWVKMDGTIVEDGDSVGSSEVTPQEAASQPPQPQVQRSALDNTVSVPVEVHPLPTSPLSSPTKNQPAAIVTPFNYKPHQPRSTQVVHPVKAVEEKGVKASSQDSDAPAQRQMTKTEMLLARRKQRAMEAGSSGGSEASLNQDSNEEKKSSCLVTTV